MFDKAGSKIRRLAMVLFVIFIIGTVILAFVHGDSETSFSFRKYILTLAVGGVGSYVSCLLLSAFGELVENVGVIASDTKDMASDMKKNIDKSPLSNSVRRVEAKQPASTLTDQQKSKLCEMLVTALAYKSDNGAGNYILRGMGGMDENEIAALEPIKKYLHMDKPDGLKDAINDLLKNIE